MPPQIVFAGHRHAVVGLVGKLLDLGLGWTSVRLHPCLDGVLDRVEVGLGKTLRARAALEGGELIVGAVSGALTAVMTLGWVLASKDASAGTVVGYSLQILVAIWLSCLPIVAFMSMVAAMTGSPVATVFLGGSPTMSTFLLALAAIAAFLANEPLLIMVGERGTRLQRTDIQPAVLEGRWKSGPAR